jgi:hypothetical protein
MDWTEKPLIRNAVANAERCLPQGLILFQSGGGEIGAGAAFQDRHE